jgi:hypothetical protein
MPTFDLFLYFFSEKRVVKLATASLKCCIVHLIFLLAAPLKAFGGRVESVPIRSVLVNWSVGCLILKEDQQKTIDAA